MANVLNFSTDNLITGVNVIDGNLYWTDDRNEPKKIEIERWKAADISTNSGATTVDRRLFSHEDITVIRPHPFEVIDLELLSYDDTSFDTERELFPEPPFENIFPRFSYRWRYEDGQYSPYAPFTQAAFMSAQRSLTATGTRGEPDFEPTTEEANYLEGFNTTMFNNVGRITLNNIPRGGPDVIEIDILYTESIATTIYVLETLSIPEEQRGIDFTLTSAYTTRVQGDGFGATTAADFTFQPLSFEVTTRKIYRALPANQLSRPFDSVPRLAKSQEVTANRLIYGNYLQNYNQDSGVDMSITTIPSESFPQYEDVNHKDYDQLIQAFLLAESRTDGQHVKGNRTYEIGVAYIDSFGRQGAMLQNISTFNADGTLNPAQAFRTAFHQDQREALQITINSEPPPWADAYRYFIKDVSQDYHNLIAYNIYNDGGISEASSPYIWIEFNSTDRNKIADGTIIVPRRVNDDILSTKSRHLVQDIQGQAPELIRAQLGLDGNLSGRSLGNIGHGSANITNGFSTDRTNAVPANGAAQFNLRDESIDFSQSGLLQRINGYIGRNEVEIDEGGVTRTAFAVERTGTGARAPQVAMLDGDDLESFLYVRFTSITNNRAMTNWARVTRLTFGPDTVGSDGHRTGFQFQLAENVAIEGTEDAPDGTIGVVPVLANGTLDPDADNQATGFNIINGFRRNGNGSRGFNSSGGNGSNWQMELASTELSEEALERLQGRFWVKATRSGLETARSEFNNSGELVNLHQVWFETEPDVQESNLDLFNETSDTFCVCTDHGWPNKVNWSNCVAEVTPNGVYLEATRINDRFNTVQLVRGVRVNVPQERYAEERRPYGLTWSGIYNSRTGINRFNEFIRSDGITKELEPNYGAIQKLHTRDTNILAFTENKVFRILADKDQLFNADGGGNVSASNAVLGQTTPFNGEYGIGTRPESFAYYGHNVYFADAKRGVMCQLTPSNGQIFEMSSKGMNDFFRDRLFSATKIVGMFDDYTDKYIVSIQGYDPDDPNIAPADSLGDDGNLTLGYELDVEGWSSRSSFIPEGGITLNNKFYTWNNGRLWIHNSPRANYNNFYGTQYQSEIEVIFNDAPSQVINFLTLNYEGTEGWEIQNIQTNLDDTMSTLGGTAQEGIGIEDSFVLREGKYYTSIVSDEPVYVYDNTMPNNVRQDGTRISAGSKGHYCKVRFRTREGMPSQVFQELFSIGSEVIPSS